MRIREDYWRERCEAFVLEAEGFDLERNGLTSYLLFVRQRRAYVLSELYQDCTCKSSHLSHSN